MDRNKILKEMEVCRRELRDMRLKPSTTKKPSDRMTTRKKLAKLCIDLKNCKKTSTIEKA